MNKRLCIVIAMACVAAFRVLIVSDDEIVPITADSVNYASQANYYLSSSAFDRLPSQRPGLSILALASSQFGIPFKLFLDGLLLVISLLAFRVVRGITKSSTTGFCVYGLIMLNPWFIANSKFFMTEPVSAIWLIGLLLSAVRFIAFPIQHWRWQDVGIAGAISSMFVLTRPEFPLLIGFWGLVICAACFVQRKTFRRGNRNRFWMVTIFAPLLIAVLSMQIVKQIHRQHYGVAALSCIEMPGFKSLVNSLYSIPPNEEIRFAPVTRQSLSAACDVSPTLGLHREILLDVNRPAYASAKRAFGFEGEFATWLNWHLLGAFGVDANVSQRMQKAANEISDAQSDGKIGKRFAFFPVDPLWRDSVSEIGGKTLQRMRFSISPATSDLASRSNFMDFRGVEDRVKSGFFDSSLYRRSMFDRNTACFRLYGRSGSSKYRRVELINAAGKILDVARITKTRNGQTQFAFEWSQGHANDRIPVSLKFRSGNKNSESFEIALLGEMKQRYFKVDQPHETNTDSSESIEHWRISLSRQKPRRLRAGAQKFLREWFGVVTWGVLALAFLSGLRTTNTKRIARIIAIIAIGFLFVFGRSLFYGLVEVWLNWGEFRYVEPNVFLSTTTAALAAFGFGAVIRVYVTQPSINATQPSPE